jgi:signal transduction histidine kinase
MIDTMSDIVWTINPKNDDFENVLKRMRFFAGELLSGKNILLQFELDERVKKLKFTMQERKNIYLVYKEAVNNVFKYSAATEVKVNIARDGQYFVLTIQDNGQGFNTDERRNSGNGLTNMANRATEIAGKINIESNAGHGTKVSLHIRLH